MAIPVSLVTTVYNRQMFLAETIESILAQTYPTFELLIWDDGSTDDSLQIARYYAQRDSRIQVFAGKHQGIAPALKAAISMTTGAYIGWVDSDDLLAPTALAETVSLLNQLPEVGLVYTDYWVVNADGKNQTLGMRCQIPYSMHKLLVSFMTFHFRLMRRAVYQRVGGIEASFKRASDYDLCLKLSEVTPIYPLKLPLYSYRRHAENVTNDQSEQIRWSYKASQDALIRRGLQQKYELSLQATGEFLLCRKS